MADDDGFAAMTRALLEGRECGAETCGAVLRAALDDLGVPDVTITRAKPLVRSTHPPVGMTCPHGETWYAAPTSEQIAQWAEDGVA